MAVFLIDVNLPYRFSLWAGPDYAHIKDLGETWTDSQIWQYAQMHGYRQQGRGFFRADFAA